MAKVSTRADMALIQGAKAVGESMAPADLWFIAFLAAIMPF